MSGCNKSLVCNPEEGHHWNPTTLAPCSQTSILRLRQIGCMCLWKKKQKRLAYTVLWRVTKGIISMKMTIAKNTNPGCDYYISVWFSEKCLLSFLKQMAILIYRVTCHSYHPPGLPPKIKKSYSSVIKESYTVCWIMFSCFSRKLCNGGSYGFSWPKGIKW